MTLRFEDVTEGDHALLSSRVAGMLDEDVVLSAIVMTECLRLRSVLTLEEVRDCCLIVVTRSPLCRRAFRELVARDLGETAAGLVESWSVQGGVLCWPQRKRRMAEQLRRADVRSDGPMASAVAQETPLGSVCLLVMTAVNDRPVTVVVQYRLPEFLAAGSPTAGER